MQIKYIISLDLSTRSTGVALFNVKDKQLIASSKVTTKKPTGLLINIRNENIARCSQMMNNIDEYLNNVNKDKKLKINNQNTIIVIERRLSGMASFTTNKTIESLAQLSGSVIQHFNVDLGYIMYHVSPTSWQNHLFGVKKNRTEDTKTLSKKFAHTEYGLDKISDDESDSICIGHYYLHNKCYTIINNQNAKEILYKSYAKTQVELFSVISFKDVFSGSGRNKNICIKDIMKSDKVYKNAFAVDCNTLLYEEE